MAFGMDFDTWAKKWDPSKLGGVQSSYGLNPTWGGSGEDSLSASLPLWVTNTPAAMQKLGLTQADFGLVPGRQESDNLIADQWNLSDKAKKALAGWSVDSLAYGRGQHVNVLRDADGNILNISKPLKTGPDLLEKAVTGIIAAGTGGILGQALGFLSPTINPLVPSTWGGAVGGGAAGTAGAASSPYSLAGSGASLGSSAAAASPYALTGAQLGNTAGAVASGLTGTGSGLGISNLANALATSGIGAGIGSSLPAAGESFLGTGASTWGGGAASGVGTLPADPFGGAAVPAIAPETLSTAGFEPLSLTPFVEGSELTGGSGIFDSIISGAKSVDSFFKGSWLARSLLSMAGAGVAQMSAEKAADKARKALAEERQKDRDWQDKRDADKRRRAMPVAGMLGRARVITGGGNGG